MSKAHSYKAVFWNRQKKIYDRLLTACVLGYLALFVSLSLVLHPEARPETHLIRGFGTAAFLLLHIVLSVGPLSRLNPRFLPLLYNRRHMGVTMFFLALAHSVFMIIQHHGLGDTNPFVSIFISNTHYGSLGDFPFQVLGLGALVILFLMAATSHDFWLANLTAPIWKILHMNVYIAYGLIVGHVALGVLQSETSAFYPVLVGSGFTWIIGIHLLTGFKERRKDIHRGQPHGEYVDVFAVGEIPEDRAKVAVVAGERVAVFKHQGKIAALSNVCQHQNGPLGEGRVIDGLVTCPWHGYQYRMEDGCSPEPFIERIPTFQVKIEKGRVLIHRKPNAPGTPMEPAHVE